MPSTSFEDVMKSLKDVNAFTQNPIRTEPVFQHVLDNMHKEAPKTGFSEGRINLHQKAPGEASLRESAKVQRWYIHLPGMEDVQVFKPEQNWNDLLTIFKIVPEVITDPGEYRKLMNSKWDKAELPIMHKPEMPVNRNRHRLIPSIDLSPWVTSDMGADQYLEFCCRELRLDVGCLMVLQFDATPTVTPRFKPIVEKPGAHIKAISLLDRYYLRLRAVGDYLKLNELRPDDNRVPEIIKRATGMPNWFCEHPVWKQWIRRWVNSNKHCCWHTNAIANAFVQNYTLPKHDFADCQWIETRYQNMLNDEETRRVAYESAKKAELHSTNLKLMKIFVAEFKDALNKALSNTTSGPARKFCVSSVLDRFYGKITAVCMRTNLPKPTPYVNVVAIPTILYHDALNAQYNDLLNLICMHPVWDYIARLYLNPVGSLYRYDLYTICAAFTMNVSPEEVTKVERDKFKMSRTIAKYEPCVI